jgi:DNA-binding IscR family transcriptional regulator
MGRMIQQRDPDPKPDDARDAGSKARESRRWSFLSHHAHLLLALAEEPEARMRDLAERLGITERSVQRIVADLEADGFLERRRRGRRNAYTLHLDRSLPGGLETDIRVATLIRALRPD